MSYAISKISEDGFLLCIGSEGTSRASMRYWLPWERANIRTWENFSIAKLALAEYNIEGSFIRPHFTGAHQMDHALYQGQMHPELIGQYAEVKPHTERDDVLLAQFDNRDLQSETIAETREEFLGGTQSFIGRYWGYGWHELPIADMPLVVRIRVRV